MQLTGRQKRHLRGLGQRLEPAVRVGHAGLSEGVLAKLDAELGAHELVKVRFGEHKDRRKELAAELAEHSKSTLIGIVGNTLVLFRRNPDPERQKIELRD